MDVDSRATRFGEDDEIELELCLSLGGSQRKKEEPKAMPERDKSTGDRDSKGLAINFGGGACVDALSKREIQAFRRQEARQKREAKQQQRRGLCRGRNGVVWGGEGELKRTRMECSGGRNGVLNGVNLNLTVEQNALSDPNLFSRVQHPYPAPNPGGYTVSFSSKGSVDEAKNLIRREGSKHVMNEYSCNGFGSGQFEENVKPICSSSIVSDPNCSPRLGGGSSCDSGMNSRQTGQEETDDSKERSNVSVTEAPNVTGNGSLPQLSQLPCVTTTGNGPDGKTVNGFLYRYSKSEISIVCVCHGRSFSPPEFILHAGGTQVSHPLRHITVIPTPF